MEQVPAPIGALIIWIVAVSVTSTNGFLCPIQVPSFIYSEEPCSNYFAKVMDGWIIQERPTNPEDIDENHICKFKKTNGHVSIPQCCSGWTGPIENQCPIAICNDQCINNGGVCDKPHVCNCAGTGRHGANCENVGEGPPPAVIEQVHDLSFRTCINSGTHYFRTFDGMEFVFGGTCTYVLAKTDDITVMVEHIDCEEYGSCKKRLIIETAFFTITIFDDRVYRDLQEIECGPEGTQVGHHMTLIYLDIIDVQTDQGLKIKFDGYRNILVTVEKDILSQVTGICGNNNGIPDDDLVGPGGESFTNLISYANSWQENVGEVECTTSGMVPDYCDTPEMEEIATQYCSKLHSNVFAECLNTMQSSILFDTCKNEICRNANESVRREIVCDSLDGLGRRCGCLGYDIAWRSEDLCPKQCPRGFVYQSNISPCPRTCSYIHSDLPDVCLQQPKVSMCACPEGQYLHKGECIDAVECPCKMNAKEYKHDDYALLQCNLCQCKLGQWVCEQNRCPATCSVIGLHHVTTWDGRTYSLRPPTGSGCSYNFIKTVPGMESDTNNLDVKVFTRSFDQIMTRLFKVEMRIGVHRFSIEMINEEPVLRVQDIETSFPYEQNDIFIKRATTEFVVVKAFGILFYTDLNARLYFRIDPYFSDKIIGMCGRFDYQSDNDFSIMSNDVLFPSTSIDFVQSFASPECASNTRVSPCDFQSQNMRSTAEAMCEHLRDPEFLGECYSLVNWQKYFEDCLNDLCLSGGVTHHAPMCTMTSALDNKCSEYDIQVNWENFPHVREQCAKRCEGGMEYTENARMSNTSCSDLWREDNHWYDDIRAPGCVCRDGMFLLDGICVRQSDCPCKNLYEPDAEPYQPGEEIIRQCQTCVCQSGVFECSEPEEGCIDEVICAHESQVYMFKDFLPQRHCGSKDVIIPQSPGCGCVDGLVISPTGECVPEYECPCFYGGKPRDNGSVINHRCFTMTCTNATWEMVAEPSCPGICSATGEMNYQTFDGAIYQLGGGCTFVMLQYSDLSIEVTNMLCGGYDTVCSKKIEIKHRGPTIHLARGAPLRIGDSLRISENEYTSPDGSIVVTSGGSFFTIVHLKHYGLQVQFDGGLRLYVYLDNDYMGYTRGLCGNYDGMIIGDLVLRDGTATTNVAEFSNEWAVTSMCSIVTETEDCSAPNEATGAVNPRHKWAVESCKPIIDTNGTFADCITAIGGTDDGNIVEYHKECINQACGCENGGGCECLCTALAAFAYECSNNGYPIKWRSQQLCPIQCENDQVYKACGPVCENSCKSKTASEGSDCSGCVEGCFCDDGMYRLDDNTCVPVEECPCYKDNRVYQPGDSYTTTCGSCICEDGEFLCEEDCPVCTDDQFMCGGHCIELQMKCDGHYDCEDGSDEMNCPYECPLGEFMCANGDCLPEELRCNRVYDCGETDYTDEMNCDEEMPECHEDDFRCGNETGLGALCVPIEWVCDKYPDCPDFSDENFDGCEDECTSTPEMFRCENLNCNHVTRVCDGHDDCGDGSDEAGCDDCICENAFTCHSEDECACIPGEYVCDGTEHCADGLDEQNCGHPETTTTSSSIVTTTTSIMTGECLDRAATVSLIPFGSNNFAGLHVTLIANDNVFVNDSSGLDFSGSTDLDFNFTPNTEVHSVNLVTNAVVILRQVITAGGTTIAVNEEILPEVGNSPLVSIDIRLITRQQISTISLSAIPSPPTAPVHIVSVNVEGCLPTEHCDEMSDSRPVDLTTLTISSDDLSSSEVLAIQNIAEEPFTTVSSLTTLEFKIMAGSDNRIELSQIDIQTNADSVTIAYLTLNGEQESITVSIHMYNNLM
ncbi:hypothetical protein ACF0H5_014392 [Mactra antiquata]